MYLKRKIAIVVTLSLLIAPVGFVRASDTAWAHEEDEVILVEPSRVQPDIAAPRQPDVAQPSQDDFLVDELKTKFKNGTLLLRKLDASLESQKENLSDINQSVTQAKKKLADARTEIQSLKGQLYTIQRLEKESARKLLAIRRQIAERENAIVAIRETLAQKSKEKYELMQKVNLLSHETVPQPVENGIAVLARLVAFNDLSENMQQDFFAQMLYAQSSDQFKEVDRVTRELAVTTENLRYKTAQLAALYKRFDAEMTNIGMHKDSKKRLLLATKNKEEIYEELVEQTKAEQAEVQKIVENLRQNYEFVNQKLEALKENDLLSGAIALEDFEDALQQMPLNTKAPLRWPVAPIRGITAYFHDEEYKKAMGIAHNAIDIPVPQETKVRAAQTGIVHKVKNSDDESYNYVIIAHRDGYLTLYGHMNQISVKEGDTVFAGQTIGLSGGVPGTRGAGWLTTGAHVHFEVFKDWKHVDPLSVLPLEYLPIEYVPQQYLARLTESDEESGKVSREAQQKVPRVAEEEIKEIESFERVE